MYMFLSRYMYGQQSKLGQSEIQVHTLHCQLMSILVTILVCIKWFTLPQSQQCNLFVNFSVP